MFTVAKFDFPPEAPAGPYKVVSLPGLKRALLAKRLGRILAEPQMHRIKPPWGSKRLALARPRTHPTIQRAERWCDSQILADLTEGILEAYAFVRIGGHFHRIPPAYWAGFGASFSTQDILIDFFDGRYFPKEFSGSPIYVFDNCARKWLFQRKIEEANPAFPGALRILPIAAAKQMPPDDLIKGQMTKMRATGIKRDEIAKLIGGIPGFEAVGNEYARGVIKGLFGRGRPKKYRPDK